MPHAWEQAMPCSSSFGRPTIPCSLPQPPWKFQRSASTPRQSSIIWTPCALHPASLTRRSFSSSRLPPGRVLLVAGVRPRRRSSGPALPSVLCTARARPAWSRRAIGHGARSPSDALTATTPWWPSPSVLRRRSRLCHLSLVAVGLCLVGAVGLAGALGLAIDPIGIAPPRHVAAGRRLPPRRRTRPAPARSLPVLYRASACRVAPPLQRRSAAQRYSGGRVRPDGRILHLVRHLFGKMGDRSQFLLLAVTGFCLVHALSSVAPCQWSSPAASAVVPRLRPVIVPYVDLDVHISPTPLSWHVNFTSWFDLIEAGSTKVNGHKWSDLVNLWSFLG